MQHSNSNLKLITIVIPCLNEQQSISTLYYELKNVQKEMPRSYRWETLFVDDGSNDQSLDIIKRLCQTDASVKYISLSRNFGHNNALIAGITHAKGDAVITLDCDLQHPPCLIKKMIAVWSQGYDVINMVRKGTVSNSWFKSYSAHCFYLLLKRITALDLEEGVADFKLYDKKVKTIIEDNHEYDLFLRGIVKWYGFKQVTISYTPNPRLYGKTKYTKTKMLKLAFNAFTSFTIKPLRLSLGFALIFITIAFFECCYALYIRLYTENAVSGWTSLIILISLIGASNMFMLGIIGEYLGRCFMQSKGRPNYIINETNC